MVFDILEVFNLFPYSQLWRVSKQPQHNSRCSIITSLILVLAVGALFIQRLVVVFQKNTMESVQQTVVRQDPPPTTITTKQGETDSQPFMFAVDFHSGHPQYNLTNYPFNIKAWVSNLTGPIIRQRTGYNTSITLEPCTPEHFSIFPNIQTQYYEWRAYNWLCLPLNQQYILQGSYAFSNTFTRICLMFNCSTELKPGQNTSCMSSFHDFNIKLYTLSVVVNPTNSTTPQQNFLTSRTLPIQRDVHQEYTYDLTQNFVEIDDSIFPWESTHVEHSLLADTFLPIQRNVTANESSTFIYYHRSSKTNMYKVKYVQLVDALSFVGGIFQVVVGIFFFMIIFGRVFFEFKFARRYFKTDAVRQFGFFNVVQQLVYKGLRLANCPPEWQKAGQRYEYQQTVNHMLDIVYLQRRIDTLERALPILLEQHQIKGLYLAQPKDRQKSNQNYKEHQLRDRLIGYLDERCREDARRIEQAEKRQIQLKRVGSQAALAAQLNDHDRRRGNQPPQNEGSSQKRISNYRIGQFDVPFIRRSSLQSRKYRENKQVYQQLLRKVAEQRGRSVGNPIDQKQIREDLLPALLKLLDDIDGPIVDERSLRIYNSLEEWMQEILKNTICTRELQVRKRQSLDQIGSQVE